jgi:hypothetical protein
VGIVPRHAPDAAALAPRTGATQVDLPQGPQARQATHRPRACCVRCADGEGESALGLRPDRRGTAQARDPGGCHHDPDPAAATGPRSRTEALWTHLDAVLASAGRGDRRVRLLHGGDDSAADAVCVVLHRGQHPARCRHRGHGQPQLSVGHPAGQERRDGLGRSAEADQVPAARPRRQVHRFLRRGVPHPRRAGALLRLLCGSRLAS